MKVSFLIPSKDRLDLMKQAVASVLDQEGMELEVIITDNASSEDYRSYVDALQDSRVIYFRQAHPVSVTENWQRALSLSTGDYVLMLGDDDALAPNFLSMVCKHLTADAPDIVYLAAYHYCYPNVLPAAPRGYLASVLNSEFFSGKSSAFSLNAEYACELAESVLAFHLRFGMNAQHFLLNSSFIRGFADNSGIYQSPYPDTFSSVAALVHAKSIVVVPTEFVIIGISPKSFGAYYFSGRHDEGYRFLDNEQVEPAVRSSLSDVILPGDRNNTNWLVAAECVRKAYPSKVAKQVNFARYRALQMIGVLRDSYLHGHQMHLAELRLKLVPSELLLFEALEFVIKDLPLRHMMPKAFDAITAQLGQYHPATVTMIDIGPHKKIWDAFMWLKRHAGHAPASHRKAPRKPSLLTRVLRRSGLASSSRGS